MVVSLTISFATSVASSLRVLRPSFVRSKFMDGKRVVSAETRTLITIITAINTTVNTTAKEPCLNFSLCTAVFTAERFGFLLISMLLP